jgi:hypothetical protein
MLDLQSGQMTPIGDHRRDVAYGGAQFAPDGTLWVTSTRDRNSSGSARSIRLPAPSARW